MRNLKYGLLALAGITFIPSTANANYVTNDPINNTDPTGMVTCANQDCSTAYVDPNPTGQTNPNNVGNAAPLNNQQIADQGCINCSPMNVAPDKITFINDTPGGASTNLPLQYDTAISIETAVINSGVNSININSTTGGSHSPRSRHGSGQAVDINNVNGTSVSSQGASPAVTSLQSAFAGNTNARENFGPSVNQRSNIHFVTGVTTRSTTQAAIVNGHRDHMHFSTQSVPVFFRPRIKPPVTR